MSEPRKILGLWWLPSAPADKWIGTLTLAPDESPELRTTVQKGFELHTETSPGVLHGCDQHGRPITLLYVGQPGAETAAVLSQHTWTAGCALLGIELPGPQAFCVNALYVSLQHLSEWVQMTGFQSLGFAPDFTGYKVEYRRPEDVSFALDGERTVGFSFSSGFDPTPPKAEMSEGVSICFKSTKGFSFADCDTLTRSIRYLLHFAVLKQIYPLETTAYKEGYGDQVGEHFSKRSIEVCSALSRLPVKPEKHPDRWVFRFADVKVNFGEFYAKWLAFVEQFDEALGCYSSTIYHRLPDSVEHLSLTQALEAYHSIKFNSHKGRIFEEKIRDLAEAHKAQLTGLIDDPSDFAKTVLDNRNYYTHYNPEKLKAGRVVSGMKLYRLNEKLRLLFQMCVLADMGIPAERFVRLRHQLASRYVDYC